MSLILLTLILYFAVLFTVSYLTGRRADNAGFFTGGRRQSWPVVAFAMIGASISGVTFVSVPGMVAVSGFGYLQMVLGFVLGQVVIAFVLTPLYYRMNLISIYGYLERRFGRMSYHTGAWFFFLSKMLGASVRLLLMCVTLQLLVFAPLGLPFWLTTALTVALVWLYTFRGGVKTIVWTDSLKTLCLIVSVALSIGYIARDLQFSLGGMLAAVADSPMSRVFFMDDVNSKQFFLKQFLAGAFTMIATNGLDQDMMQRNLSCRNPRESQKNMMTSILLQLVVITLFLVLGVLLYLFADSRGLTVSRGDELFPLVATGGYFPAIVGVLFILGFVSAAHSAAGSALTALTTSFTVDILGVEGRSEQAVGRMRRWVHMGMAVLMALVIIAIHAVNRTSVIDAVYTLASYTYGPILGLFAFGILMRQPVRDRGIPVVAIASPLLCLLLQTHSEQWLGGYQMSYELLIVNALLTFLGLCLLIKRGASCPTGTSERQEPEASSQQEPEAHA